MVDGDKNSKFFHAVVNQRRRNNFISSMTLVDGTILSTPEQVHQGAVCYFQEILSGAEVSEVGDLSPLLDKVIADEDNFFLCNEPMELEVKEALLSIPKHSSPGPDGFGSGFFSSCWELVKDDVVEAAKEFFSGNFESGKIKAFSHPLGAPLISHLLYADDLLIFLNGEKRSLRRLIEVLGCYERWSGQLINKEKSALFFSDHITQGRRVGLKRLTGFVEGKFPVVYLGVPLVVGRLKVRDLEPLVTKIRNKVAGWKYKLLSQGGRLTLLGHVLSSMSMHLLAVLNIPKAVHHKIDSILSTFFWGVSAGHPKRKWRSWSHLCKPTNEGGLNLRNSLEVQRALHMKFVWHLMSGDSLWNKFFQAKYVKKGHVALASDNSSRFWKSVMGVLPEVLENVRLMVKEGKGSFWYDRWLSSGPLSLHPNVDITPSLCIKDLWVENSWDRDKLVELVGSVKTEEIVQTIAAGRNGEDVLVWMPSKDGKFSSASAWDRIRVRAPQAPEMKWIWHGLLPKRVSVCVWKSRYDCLPVDENICRVGIQLASKCGCCVFGQGESRDHVLSSSEFAGKMWALAEEALGISVVPHSWWSRVFQWWSYAKTSTTRGTLIGILPCVITWRLWLRRCKARMEGIQETVEGVWLAVKACLRNISGCMKNHGEVSSVDMAMLAALEVTNDLSFSISHQFREWNMVADFLARSGEGGCSRRYEDYDMLPKELKGIIRLESFVVMGEAQELQPHIIGVNMMYTYGIFNLPVSTYSLICSTQLAFTALFSFFLNSQKFTPFIINSVVLVTISAILLIVQPNSADTMGTSNKKDAVGFLCTVGASAGYSLLLSLMQLSFQKVLKRETFNVVLEMIIYRSLIATSVSALGLFASGEWKSLAEEMEKFGPGKLSYVMTLVWTAVAWQVCSIGSVGLIFEASSLFSNVITTVALPVIPILAVIFFHDKMDGLKVVSMLLAIWGFVSYIYQHYLDDSKSKAAKANVNEDLDTSNKKRPQLMDI
ncbi:hypothetical protein HHK36_001593 [Tetracentron sinense]|uniref:Reverse transcriptase zinc-binding domain-containing protein n=1 Tax=Tetracentron sinense TaxID=13715 RepID=A0A835A307_TETSI|nr:hypothetical protein HHK36_001593 [Tetracentron sinense]